MAEKTDKGFLKRTLSRAGVALRAVRRDRLPYMLIFSFAPIFSFAKFSVGSGASILGLDGVFVMGIAYALGIGLCFLPLKPESLHRFGRVYAAAAAVTFCLWAFLPETKLTPCLMLLFGLSFGGCSAVALFGYIYALTATERLLGAAVTVLFTQVSQLLCTFPPLTRHSGTFFFGLQVLVTALCLFRFDPGDYAANAQAERQPRYPLLAMALFFFFAQRAVMFFYSYLSHPGPSLLLALAGLLAFALSLLIFFVLEFNIWHLCNLFFVGMIVAYSVRYALPGADGMIPGDLFHSFGYMGFIASYYFLGGALSAHADMKRLKRLLPLLFAGVLLLHVLPGRMAAVTPQAMPLAGAVLTLVLFIVFALIAPAFSRALFPKKAPLPNTPETRLAKMQAAGLSRRESEVAEILYRGFSLKECAAQLDISPETAKFHSRNIYKKLNLCGRTELPGFFEKN